MREWNSWTIRTFRERLALTPDQLAKILNLDVRTIYYLERGRPPSPLTIIRLNQLQTLITQNPITDRVPNWAA